MEVYRERLKTGQVISDAVPLRQRFPEQEVSVVGPAPKAEIEADESPQQTMDNESVSSGSEDNDGSAGPMKAVEEPEVVDFGTGESNETRE